MPLLEQGAMYKCGIEVEKELEDQLTQFCKLFDAEIEDLSREVGQYRAEIRFVRPLHFFAAVTETAVFVVLALHEYGGAANWRIVYLPDESMNLESVANQIAWDFALTEVFGFRFSRKVLELEDNAKREEIALIAEKCLVTEIERLDQQRQIVRLKPIFQGRDFLINEELVFVLSPFGEPFDTIYEDHIRPSVERIPGMKCQRANDIYDTQPIIEDIWRLTNEARLLIAELTGKNANVFYETGIAHTVGKEVILITQSMDDVPFDLTHRRCIVYEHTPRGCETLENDLENTIRNIRAKAD